MAKKPTDTSGGSAVPPSKARIVTIPPGTAKAVGKANITLTNADGSSTTFKDFPVIMAGIVEASSTAVESLSTASEVATETGHVDLATASDLVQVPFKQVINNYGGTINIQQSIDVIQQLSVVTENQIHHFTETLKANDIPFYDCDEKHKECMSEATDAWARFKCRGLYAACLGYRVSEALRPLG
jgi:hypothetical protein